MADRRKKQNSFDDISQLTGVQKVAAFIIAVGTKTSAAMLKSMKQNEVEEITLEIAKMKNVKPEVIDEILKEYYQLMEAKKYILEGGVEYAEQLLNELGGNAKSEQMLKKLKAQTASNAFDDFQESKITQVASFIQNEHPQVAALIFSQLHTDKSAEILSYLPPEMQAEIIYRLASMEKVSLEVIQEIEEVIKEHMGGLDTMGDRVNSGTATVAQILNDADIAVEKHVLDMISQKDPQMASDIKEQMFLFEDIIHFDDKTVQLIVNEMEKSDLVLSLKGVETELTQKFLGNMSQRAAAMLQEDMEALGPVPLKDVKEAQQKVIKKIKELEENGLITTRKMSEEEVVE
ncbi:MAG: flagellar motor switch protein FliG [Balneolia bacterium]|nr:flagellar motor switch protein FliG [Balneolia bacterium]